MISIVTLEGFRLWDEIARRLKCRKEAAARREKRLDSVDAERLARMFERLVTGMPVAASASSLGHGAPNCKWRQYAEYSPMRPSPDEA